MDENTSHARQSVYVGWQIASVLTESLRGLKTVPDRHREKEENRPFSLTLVSAASSGVEVFPFMCEIKSGRSS